MLGALLAGDASRHVGASQGALDKAILEQGSVAGSNGVNLLLVGVPECGPVHGDNVAARALANDEVAESGNSHTTATNTTDGGHARIIPAPDVAVVDKLGELALRQECLDEVETGEVPHVNLAEAKGVEEPLVLGVTVGVLGRAESVGDALVAVNDGAGKVVHGVHLPGSAGAVVSIVGVAAVDDGVAHGLVGVVDRHLGTDAVGDTLLGTLLHLLKDAEVLLDGALAALGGTAVHTLITHSLLVGVVGVSHAHTNELLAHVVQVVEVVGSVSHGVGLDTHQGKILNNGILVLGLLLGGVGVVETKTHLALVGDMAEVIAEKSGLGVSDVKVATIKVLEDIDHNYDGSYTYEGSGRKRVTTPLSVS